MIMVVNSVPHRCPGCKSDNLDQRLFNDGGNVINCNNCGGIISIQEFRTSSDSAPCPHCGTVGDLQVSDGEEWCGYCGLDPSVTEYPSPDLAHLWKDGSEIQRLLNSDAQALQPHLNMGKFVREECGPRCVLATECPQSRQNFILCLQEWREERHGYGEAEMSKRRRKHQRSAANNVCKLSKKERKQAARAAREANKRAYFQCAAGGWFQQRFVVSTEDVSGEHSEIGYLEQSGAT